MFYEAQNLLRANDMKIEHGVDFSFPPHLHGSFEIVTVLEGELKVRIDSLEYSLTYGNALLIFPNQVHELITETHSSHYLCIFSPNLIQTYSHGYLARVPENNLFTPNSFYLHKLISINDGASITEIKGLLYSLCGEFDSTAVYRERSHEGGTLLSQIFRFVEEHFDCECSLSALSAKLTYSYVYLSKYFKERTGIAFTDYVNRYRINEACYLIGSTGKSMLQVAYDSGFDSLRSFNRNFRKIMGISPGEYRKLNSPNEKDTE